MKQPARMQAIGALVCILLLQMASAFKIADGDEDGFNLFRPRLERIPEIADGDEDGFNVFRPRLERIPEIADGDEDGFNLFRPRLERIPEIADGDVDGFNLFRPRLERIPEIADGDVDGFNLFRPRLERIPDSIILTPIQGPEGTSPVRGIPKKLIKMESLNPEDNQDEKVELVLTSDRPHSEKNMEPKPTISLITEPSPTNTNCNKEAVNTLVKSAEETCSHISHVDTYIAKVHSKKPLSVPSFKDNHGFKDVLSQYNTDLKTAQNNCHLWRNGDSIVGSLKEMVAAAQEFQPKFTREFEQNQARVKHILENHEDIAEVEAKIATLEQEIRQAKEAAKEASAPSVLTHLEKIIKIKEEEINSTIKDHEVVQARRELEALIQYLEFVRNNAGEIEEKAENVRTKISIFKDNIVKDGSAFKRHRTNAQEGITRLNQERQNNNQELASIQTDMDSLSRKITAERAQITSLNGQIQHARNELRDIENRIASGMRKARKRKKIGRFLRVIPVAGWIAGHRLIQLANRKERQLADQKRAFINEHTQMVQNLQAQIARGTGDIVHYQNRISSHVTRSHQLEQELVHFSKLDGDLQSVENEVNSILPFIANAINVVSKMRDIFDAVQQNLEDIIEKAKISKTEAEVKNIKYFIYNEVEELKCKWNEASEKIGVIKQCS